MGLLAADALLSPRRSLYNSSTIQIYIVVGISRQQFAIPRLTPSILRIDTAYYDVSKSSEARMSTLRSDIQHWFDIAAWYRPTILILDNIDKLAVQEAEVGRDRL